MTLWKRINQKVNPAIYKQKDSHLNKTLTTTDLLALGIGTLISISIFTLPGIVAAEHTGPAVVISFIIDAVAAGLVAMNYSEMASAMPFTGAGYSWINVLFGHFWGWIVGWALLAEFFISIAFQASGISSNLQGLLDSAGLVIPKRLANPIGVKGGYVDIISLIVIILVSWLVSRGDTQTSRVENALVVLKVLAVVIFVLVGMSAVHTANYHPFIPAHQIGTRFGGWQGIYAGTSMLFISYTGFGTVAANAGEAKNPKKSVPFAITGAIAAAAVMFIAVSLVLVGMFPYKMYANNSEPVGWALRHMATNHPALLFATADFVQGIAVLGMFTALISFILASSRLLYSFGRDGMVPSFFGKINKKRLPNNSLFTVTCGGVLLGALLSFQTLSQVISAGTLVAFMIVSLGIYALRHREGKDLPKPQFKVPFYPIEPAFAFLVTLIVFLGLSSIAKIYAICWFILGMIVYFSYSMKHSKINAAKVTAANTKTIDESRK
ncbi:APC family permease [Acetilactobacillus jinshanensis]|uniref:Amino acid permease n=1 Tax=Acetilactobacillus jinshanensis TaxID=1720083 RepID=A0A4V1ALH8_9LACO|nr:APC family permease [Acetilactobacillus jinshanensis]QBP17649.1 amino acid permease [Acetilactobacillus jinshanensis]URL61809.1 amino acid permease [uncultured bacterium]